MIFPPGRRFFLDVFFITFSSLLILGLKIHWFFVPAGDPTASSMGYLVQKRWLKGKPFEASFWVRVINLYRDLVKQTKKHTKLEGLARSCVVAPCTASEANHSSVDCFCLWSKLKKYGKDPSDFLDA